MTAQLAGVSFLHEAPPSPAAQQQYDDDLTTNGYVMNFTKLWAHHPALRARLFDLIGATVGAGSLTVRQRGVLTTACAAALGDAYCSLAWGRRLAAEAGVEAAAGVVRGDDHLLDPAERALARWARQITRDPNATRPADVQALRDHGFDDGQILAITVFVAVRIAFSTVNDALGTQPDRELGDAAPPALRDAVAFGRATMS